MIDFYNLLDKYPTLSLQALGLLVMACEPNANFNFQNRDSFLLYFRLSSQHVSEKLWSELIDLGIVQRVIIDDVQKYCIFKKIKFDVPLKISKNTSIVKHFNEQIHFIHKGFHGKVKILFNECKKHLESKSEYMRIDDVQYFFDMFKDMSSAQYIEFFEVANGSKVYSLKYLNKIAISIKSQKKTTYSENLSWDKEKEENSFALKVATGEAIGRSKYENLLRQNKIETLRAYYDKGKKLLLPNQKLYTGYDWV